MMMTGNGRPWHDEMAFSARLPVPASHRKSDISNGRLGMVGSVPVRPSSFDQSTENVARNKQFQGLLRAFLGHKPVIRRGPYLCARPASGIAPEISPRQSCEGAFRALFRRSVPALFSTHMKQPCTREPPQSSLKRLQDPSCGHLSGSESSSYAGPV